MKKYKNVICHIGNGMIVLAVCMIFALLGLICLREKPSVQIMLPEAGYRVLKDYTYEEVEDATAPKGVRQIYTFCVGSERWKDRNLIFYTIHQYIKVYKGEELVYTVSPTNSIPFVKTTGAHWVTIPINREDAGSILTIEITPIYQSVIQRTPEFLSGSKFAVAKQQIREEWFQLVIGIMAVGFGILYIFITFYVQDVRKYRNDLGGIGLFAIILGIWKLMDTRLISLFLIEKQMFVYYLCLAMLMLVILPLIKYAKEYMEYREQKDSCPLRTYRIVVSLVYFAQLGLQFSGKMDLRETLFGTHFLIISGILVLVYTQIQEIKKYGMQHRHMGNRWIIICSVGGILDILQFYHNPNSSELIFTMLTFLTFVILMGVVSISSYGMQEMKLAEKDRELAEKKIELAQKERILMENQVEIMMSQIKPHFVYNTLGTIEYFCEEDPQQAKELVECFSRYLRGNFVELNSTKLIPVRKELEHVKCYLDIEQVRFPDIQVIYDIQADDFAVPALSIQPLVENAVKHGLLGLEKGGYVSITTMETEKEYCIIIEDDGVGFTEQRKDDGRKHVGIANIRSRLEKMCGGQLLIDSTVGAGTRAEIRISKIWGGVMNYGSNCSR